MVSTSKQVTELQHEVEAIKARLIALEDTQARFKEYDDFLGIPSRSEDQDDQASNPGDTTPISPSSPSSVAVASPRAPSILSRRNSAPSIRSRCEDIDLTSLLKSQRHLAANLRIIHNNANAIGECCEELAGMMRIPDESARKWKDLFLARCIVLRQAVEGLQRRCGQLCTDVERLNGIELELALRKLRIDAEESSFLLSPAVGTVLDVVSKNI